MFKYVTIKKLCEFMGYSEQAARKKIRNGYWRKGKEWIKAPDGRILFCPKEIDAWAEEKK